MAASVRQFVLGFDVNGTGATLPSAVVTGNVLVALCWERQGTGGYVSASWRGSKDTSWTDVAVDKGNNNGGGVGLQAKTAASTSAGPFYNSAGGSGHAVAIAVYELQDAALTGYSVLSAANVTSDDPDLGDFTSVASGDIIIMGVASGNNQDPVMTFGNFTAQDVDQFIPGFDIPWMWAGRVTTPGSTVHAKVVGNTDNYGAAAVRFLDGNPPVTRMSVLGFLGT